MATTLTTPEFRGTFVSLITPIAGKNDDGTPGKLKYTLRAAFPPTTDLTALKEAAREAAVAKWGDKIPKVLRSPFRTYAQVEKDFEGIGPDWVLVTFTTNAEHKPGVFGPTVEKIEDETEVYSGAWFRAHVTAKAYGEVGSQVSPGVTFYLGMAQKTRDGEPLSGANTPANKAFEPVAGATAGEKTAANIFG